LTSDPTRQAEDTRLIRNLNSLLEVSKALGAEVELDRILSVILSKATDVMEAERSSLFIFDEASQSLSIRGSRDVAQGAIKTPLGVGIAGHVAQTRELLNIPDAYADPRFNPQSDRDLQFKTRSILCAPMLTHSGRLIGVIQVLNTVGRESFTSDDERLLAAFAALAGIALDRAQLIESFLEKKKIEASLRLAHDIQMGMVPKEFPQRPEFEIFATLRPARSVGGDLYDFRLDGGRLWFVIGDVSGKGVPAALFKAVTKVLLGAAIETEEFPSSVLTRVNRGLCRDNEQGLFVTAFLGRLDIATGELLYANAGHNPPYRLRADGTASPLPADTGLVLGVLADFEYKTESASLERGDAIFSCTDGLSEGLNPEGEEFGAQRLEAYLRGVTQRSVTDIVNGAAETLAQFVRSAPQFDDTTMLAVRYLARSS
jgi:sigma-B regulation protein RsbU (phosphoserine phosphatase)